MNLPNKLTLLRMVLVPVFIIFTIMDHFWTRFFALFIFIAAGITDLVDGYIARKYGEVTTFGKFMDPLADKMMISAAFIAFVEMREIHVPAWMVVLIISREFLVTGVRLDAASKGKIISAERSGKLKTISQFSSVIAILVILCVNSGLKHFYQLNHTDLLSFSKWYWAGILLVHLPYWLVAVATLITLISGLSYLYGNRHIFAKDVGLKF